MDYGNIVLVGALKSVTDKLQRVLNAAARIVTGTRKYDRGLSRLLHTELHWLDVPERVLYKLALMVHRCPSTRHRSIRRTTVCQSLKLPVVSNCDLPLVIHQLLLIPRYRLRTFGRRAVAGPNSGTHWQMNCVLTLVIGLK